MNRRAFLAWLSTSAGAAFALTHDVEKLLWVPKPIITVPAMPPPMFHRDAFAMVMEPLSDSRFLEDLKLAMMYEGRIIQDLIPGLYMSPSRFVLSR